MSEIRFDVSGMGNPLVDILVNVEESFLRRHGLEKGIMHLIDEKRRSGLLDSIKGRKIQVEAGGSCPNTMSALGVLGVRSALTGKVGEDEYGIAFEEQIQRRNVASYIRRGKSPTGTSIILITPDKERTMNTFLGSCREYGKQDLPREMIEGSSFFYFTGYMWDTENQKAAVREALSVAKRGKTRIIFDAADPAAAERYRADFLDLIKNDVDIVLANAQESAILTGKPADDGVRELGEHAEIAVVKNGADDTRIYSRGEYFRVPTFKAAVKDTTGAGDNFSAGFIYGLIKGFPLDRCGAIASFVAAKTIEKVGARVPDNIRELVEYTFMTSS
jgi:sugar/nucleoside kinase (ribokinase family)